MKKIGENIKKTGVQWRETARAIRDRAKKLPIRRKRDNGGLSAPAPTPGTAPESASSIFPAPSTIGLPIPVDEVPNWSSEAPKAVKPPPAGNAAVTPAKRTARTRKFNTWAELKADMNQDYSTNALLLPDPPNRPAKEDLGPDMANKDEITDARKLPKDWTHQEPHLDASDHDGQIERCDERLRKRRMNWIFEERKERHIRKKQKREEIMGKYPGLDWEVVQRLQDLEETKKELLELKDDASAENVEAVIDAYTRKSLKWHPHLVTYWLKGKQLCNPRPFEFHELDLIYEGLGDVEGLWTEALHDNSGVGDHFSITAAPSDPTFTVSLTVHVRLAPDREAFPLSFIDDTGAPMMSLFEQDIEDIRKWSKRDDEQELPAPFRQIGYATVTHGNGTKSRRPVKAVSPNIRHAGEWMAGQAFSEWPRVMCIIKPDREKSAGVQRAIGAWLRSYLYTATAPDDTHRMWIFNSLGLAGGMPDLDLTTVKPATPLFGPLAFGFPANE